MKNFYMSSFNELHFCEEEEKYILFNSNTCNWMSFDETGRQIYIALEKNSDVESACDILAKDYNAEKEEVYSDVVEFFDYLKTNRFLFQGENEENVVMDDEMLFVDKYPYNVMVISVTSVCNLDCIYCYNKEMRCENINSEITGKEMTVKVVLEKFKRNGGIGVLFTGGEPLLYENLQELCSYAQEIGLKTKIITNATRLYCVKNLEDILRGVDDMTLSIDSFDEKELRELWNVNNVNLENIEKGLERLNRYSRDKKRMNVIISPIVSKTNKDSLDKVIEKARDLLRDCEVKIEFTKYMSIGKGCDNLLSISEEEYISAYIDACKKNGIEGETTYLSALTHNGKYYPYPIKNKFLCKPSFFIKANGDVFPCQNLLEKEYFLGNVSTHSYEEMNSKFLSIMEKKSFVKQSKCKDCGFRYVCPYKGGVCGKKENDCKKKLLKVMCASVR